MSSLSLKVISWNVGGLVDTMRLMKLAKTQELITDQQAINSYNEKITKAFENHLIYGKDADIFCLQEFYPKNKDKAELVKKFEGLGFTLLGRGDLAIAFKTDRFILGETDVTSSDSSGVLYALLQDKISGIDICVVSDHVAGFHART
jgi:hypothetical protein